MTLISKGTGICSLASCIKDIHSTALIYSKNDYAKAMSDTFISCDINAQRANRLSYKDAQRKNWLLKKNFLGPINETFARIKGYLKGVGNGIIRYLPNVLCSVIAICSTNKTLANISAVLLGGIEIYDFFKNSTSLGQRNNYLK